MRDKMGGVCKNKKKMCVSRRRCYRKTRHHPDGMCYIHKLTRCCVVECKCGVGVTDHAPPTVLLSVCVSCEHTRKLRKGIFRAFHLLLGATDR